MRSWPPAIERRTARSEVPTVQRRELGQTGLTVSEISFGAWQLGNRDDWAPMSDRTALRLVGELADHWGVSVCRWYLDRPVANSGRLKAVMLTAAAAAGWHWTVDLVYNPDRILAESAQVVATSDSAILDRCQCWINLTWLIISRSVPRVRLVDLSQIG